VGALALGAHDRSRGPHIAEPPAERRDAIARQAAVGLDLGLAGPPRPDAAAQALEVGPQAPHAREVVLELGELDLQLALGAAGMSREDVEDDRRAVDDRQPSSQAMRFASARRAASLTSPSFPGPR
jgi:hypothetical protein